MHFERTLGGDHIDQRADRIDIAALDVPLNHVDLGCRHRGGSLALVRGHHAAAPVLKRVCGFEIHDLEATSCSAANGDCAVLADLDRAARRLNRPARTLDLEAAEALGVGEGASVRLVAV